VTFLRLCRAGVIGDVHAEDETLEAVLAFLKTVPNLDALLCTGDVVTGPGDTGRCCGLLRAAGVLTVRGNHDRWFFLDGYADYFALSTPDQEIAGADRTFLAGLPVTRAFDTPRGPLLLCLGLGDDDMAGVYPGDEGRALEANHRLHALVGAGAYRFIINGHTHRRMIRAFDGLTVLNAGTLRADHQPGFLVADFEAGRAECYNLSDTRQISAGETFALPAPPRQE